VKVAITLVFGVVDRELDVVAVSLTAVGMPDDTTSTEVGRRLIGKVADRALGRGRGCARRSAPLRLQPPG